MEDYKKLAIRYLNVNRKRSWTTVIGTAIVVMVLYTLLNLGWSWMIKQRDIVRREMDYEIVFLTETKAQADTLLADDLVKSAYVGSYYYYDYDNPVTYDNALYVNTKNPYFINAIRRKLEKKYGITSYLNSRLIWLYLQNDEQDAQLGLIIVLSALLFSFILAIFGVGIVRNSIQLSTLEQIRDYGNLRCIGSTRGQLRVIIYIEGAILELLGILIGLVLGTVSSTVIGKLILVESGFHILPAFFVGIAFLGDLYFAMEENCKLVINMTPISAIRGEYRIKAKRIKIRKSGIWGKIFGVEGDYAYKNLKRNSGRFQRSVWAIALGIVVVIIIGGINSTVRYFIKEVEREAGYFQDCYYGYRDSWGAGEMPEFELPPIELYENLNGLKEVTESKRLYSSAVLPANLKEIAKKRNKDLINRSTFGDSYYTDEAGIVDLEDCFYTLEQISCSGYEREDLKKCEDVLLDGTLDVSENGVILVNYGELTLKSDYETTEEFKYTDYKVGDTLELIDAKECRMRYAEAVAPIDEEYQKQIEKIEKMSEEEMDSVEKEKQIQDISSEHYVKLNSIKISVWKSLIEEKAYCTYTIEGIIKEDSLSTIGNDSCNYSIIMPLENYFEMTGYTEDDISGMMFHFDKMPKVSDYEKAMQPIMDEEICTTNDYGNAVLYVGEMKRVMRMILIVVAFASTICAINIFNTVVSNVYMRKHELAQLRVIGVSRKQMLRMVMLEGVISSIVANAIGIVGGMIMMIGVCYAYFDLLLEEGIKWRFTVPVLEIIVCVIVSTLVLCGSSYLALKDLPDDLSTDLKTASD